MYKLGKICDVTIRGLQTDTVLMKNSSWKFLSYSSKYINYLLIFLARLKLLNAMFWNLSFIVSEKFKYIIT